LRIDVTIPEGLDPYVASTVAALELGRQRVKVALKDVTPAQLEQVPPGLTNSIATIVVHLCGTEVSFSYRLAGGSTPDEVKAEYLMNLPQSPLPAALGETVESLTAKLDKSRAMLLQTLARLTTADMNREMALGPERSVTLRWAMALLPNHQTQHLGHIQMVKKLIR